MADFTILIPKGNHSALPRNYELNKGKWNVKAQFITAFHNPENAAGESKDVVTMAAYGFLMKSL
jgi:hypothetical protein